VTPLLLYSQRAVAKARPLTQPARVPRQEPAATLDSTLGARKRGCSVQSRSLLSCLSKRRSAAALAPVLTSTFEATDATLLAYLQTDRAHPCRPPYTTRRKTR
jgi:hypothetical protein